MTRDTWGKHTISSIYKTITHAFHSLYTLLANSLRLLFVTSLKVVKFISNFTNMKGKMKRKAHGFKVGNKLHLKKTVQESPTLSTNKVHYVRLTKEQHTLVCDKGPGVDPATSGGGMRYCLLRPQRSQQSELEEASVTKDIR